MKKKKSIGGKFVMSNDTKNSTAPQMTPPTMVFFVNLVTDFFPDLRIRSVMSTVNPKTTVAMT